METKALKTITQTLLLAVVAVLPFVKIITLYYPFISGKVYLFRLLVAAALFFWVWLIVKDRSYLPNLKNILVAAIILFFAAQVLVSFFSIDPFYSFFSTIERQDGVFQYGFWVLYFLMFVSVFKEERDWKKPLLIFITAALLLSLYNFFFDDPAQVKFSGVFGNPSYFGAFLLFAIGFSLIAWERKLFYPGWIHRFLPFAAVFFVLPLSLTYIRGALAGLVGGVSLFALLTFLFFRKEQRKLANLGGVFLVVIAVSSVLLFSARDTNFVQGNRLLTRVTEVADVWQLASVRERLLNWNIALKAFADKPIFGWGPENYDAAANRHYDFRIGLKEPWFDRAHSQPFDILATGGAVLFASYLFWIFAAFFLIFKIAKEKKLLSFILASLFTAYLIQDFFLFDTLAVYLGFFPFLAYLVYLSPKRPQNANPPAGGPNKLQTPILVAAAALSLFLIYTTVIVPWKANNLAWQFFNLTEQGLYKETKPYLKEAFRIESPYTFWEVRRMAASRLLTILDEHVNPKTPPEKAAEISDLYDYLLPELERYVEARPSQASNYHVMALIYGIGFEKLGKQDLDKAEELLKKAFTYSDLRVDYFNDFAKVALLRGDFEEGERIIKEHVERMPPEWGDYLPPVALANFYFEAGKYEESLREYNKSVEAGFEIQKNDFIYPRYMLAAENVGDYESIVDMGQKYLEHIGPDADTYFNVAIGYFHLDDREKAREFFLKAVELKPEEYEEYRQFFAP